MGTAIGAIPRHTAYLLRLSFVLLLFIFASIDKTSALGRFRNGRYDDGFLGEPSKFESLRRKPEPEDKWFEQKLDHFGQKNKELTWKQRYFVNDEFYRNDRTAPVFLMIGGEGEASKRWMSEGAWIKYAEHFGALCFQLEHRFYGKSHPTSDLSTKNLVYLTSEQALSDLANFIRSMKKEYNMNDNQKWIVFGGSYPGSLAAWAREKFPDLIHGAISSSGPLLAKVDFKGKIHIF
uniref:Putative serine protease F56F10.1 n=1 Tax=Bactrocera latifrons TaxID=174628 RepID=A0A0K8W1A3_BACLA